MENNLKLENPVDFFGKWAENGKDEGMEKGHAKSVQFMLNKILENQKSTFSFIDAGCGNGWVVRQMKSHSLCSYSSGIDGAKPMIEKAKSIDSGNDYFNDDLMKWIPNQKYNIVHSMEVFYYFEDPLALLKKINQSWMEDSGKLIFGIDHYKENKAAINWPQECGVYMNTLSILEWKELIEIAGFNNIQYWQVEAKDDWAGTLVFYAEK